MQYTENYQFRKPVIGVDDADVKDINFNSDRADTLIHNTQISLAPAYDLNETYNTGDVVMYETLMYKCKEDNVTGAWVPEKWERTTAGEEGSGGGGGSSVVPNPQGVPTDTLITIGIDGTVYDIAGSGGGGSAHKLYTTIYTGTQRENTITLTQGMSNFDYILMVCYSTAGTGYLNSALIPVSDISVDNHIGVSDDANYLWYIKASDTSLTIEGTQGAYYVKEIQGIKLEAGSGGDGGSAYEETTLWSGSDSATMQLSESFENYDAIMLVGKNTYNNVDYSISAIWLTSYLKAHINDGMRFGLANDSWYVYFSITNDTTFVRQDQYSVYISEIKGLKFGGGAGGGGLEKTLLWDYVTDNNNVIPYGLYTETLHDDIDNYDFIVAEIVSSSGDLSASGWQGTNLWTIDVNALNNTEVQNYLNYTSFGERSSRFYIKDTTFQKTTDNQGNTNGLVRVYGLKWAGGGSSRGGYSETSLYTYTGSTRQTTLSLSDDYTNYDAIEFTFGWNLGGDDFETVDVISSSKIVSNVFVNVGGEGRYNYISRGGADDEIILATATGSWDGSSIIREVRGINY